MNCEKNIKPCRHGHASAKNVGLHCTECKA